MLPSLKFVVSSLRHKFRRILTDGYATDHNLVKDAGSPDLNVICLFILEEAKRKLKTHRDKK